MVVLGQPSGLEGKLAAQGKGRFTGGEGRGLSVGFKGALNPLSALSKGFHKIMLNSEPNSMARWLNFYLASNRIQCACQFLS